MPRSHFAPTAFAFLRELAANNDRDPRANGGSLYQCFAACGVTLSGASLTRAPTLCEAAAPFQRWRCEAVEAPF